VAPGISELLTLSTYNVGKKLADNISKGNAALMKMEAKGNIRTFDGGVTIREALDYGTNTNVTWISGSETFGVGATEHATSAEFAIKQMVGTVSVNGLEKIQNSGKGKLIDLVTSKVKNLERNMRNTVSTDMHGDGTGSSSKTITGFLLMLPTTVTSGTYAGINRATAGNEFWRPQITTVTLTAANAAATMTDLYISTSRGTDHTDLILAGATAYGFFNKGMQLIQQITNPKMAEAGFTSLRFIGADVVLDNNVGGLTATHMLFLNTDYIHWRPFEGLNFAPIEPEKRAPTNQDVSISVMGWAGNLTCDNCNVQGRLNGA
jgi:hypothetical protein